MHYTCITSQQWAFKCVAISPTRLFHLESFTLKKKKTFSVNVLDSELEACDTCLSELIRKRCRQYGAERMYIKKQKNRMIKWMGSLHSPAITEAWSSWKPQVHLCSHLGRPNQNQIISFFPPSLPLSFSPERINYSYSAEETKRFQSHLSSSNSSALK